MTSEEAKRLISRYNADQCSEAEKALIESWYMQYNEHDIDLSQKRIEEIGEQMYNELPGKKAVKSIKIWPVTAAVAAMLLILGVATFFIKTPTTLPPGDVYGNDVAPGGNNATLTLANGKTIRLSEHQEGIIIDANKLTYYDGKSVTTPSDKHPDSDELGVYGQNKDSVLLIATTLRGGTYQIILPDGTKVWLNAASTLKFPSTFIGLVTRRVELIGEAYFEVSKDRKRPFIVLTENQAVKVLGTHFNINGYSPLETKTTLLEGSVEVALRNTRHTASSALLKPGEYAINSGAIISIKPADLNLETAWKKGKIEFKDACLKTVMDMLGRWYNIETVYQSYPSESRFSGSVSRSKNISEVLNLLESTQEVHFKIEGRRILVK